MAWSITALDYDAPLYTNAEARLGAGVSQALWAKWLHREFFTPSRRVRGGRGGQYAARKIFEIRIMNLAIEDVAIPPAEARQIADLAAKGPWKGNELTAGKDPNWRSYVLRETPPPLDVFLIFARTEKCWGYEIAIGPPFKHSASLVLAAKRELEAVSKYCWSIFEESRRASTIPED